MSHGESTYRSGEYPMYRWIFENTAPFFNKGRGRSIMTSVFIAQNDSCGIFELDENEWKQACDKHPELLIKDSSINYYERSANAWIEPKKDFYFDNEIILKQFKRLFILLKFKTAFNNCQFEIIVDNARTHSAKIYDANMFNKKPKTRCEYDSIEWSDNGESKRFFFIYFSIYLMQMLIKK